MDALNDAIGGLWADARRAATPGAIGLRVDRGDAIVTQPVEPGSARSFIPSSSALHVAIDGPGWFVVTDGRQRRFSRLGDFRFDASGALVDGEGRAVLGTSPRAAEVSMASLSPIRVSAQDARRDTATIGSDGLLSIVRDKHPVAIGRIALAIFPAPERLALTDAVSVEQTSASGKATAVFAGATNVGTLRGHALEAGLVDVSGDLAALWRLGRRADLDAAGSYADDRCQRVALDLVK